MALLFRAKEPSPLALDKNTLYLTNLGIPWASSLCLLPSTPYSHPIIFDFFLRNISAEAR